MDSVSYIKQIERKRRMKEMFNNVMILHHGIEILAVGYMVTGIFVFTIVLIYFWTKMLESKEMEKAYRKYREETENEKDK